MNRWKPAHAFLAALMLVLACTVDDPFDPSDFETPERVATQLAGVSGDDQTGGAGATLPQDLVVRVLDQFGDPVENATVAWSIESGGGELSDASNTTDEDGAASVEWTLGSGTGAQEASATIGGSAGTFVFSATALPGAAAIIVVTPDTLRFDALGDTARVNASATDAGGNAIADPDLTWTTANATRATVNGGGLVTAQGVGTTRVVASSGSVADTVVVIVTQAPAALELTPAADSLVGVGDTVRLRARVFDRNSRLMASALPTWRTTDSAVATVNSTGRVSAIGAGTASIIAAFDTVADTTSITVMIPSAIEISPAADTLWTIGDTTRLAATVTDSAGDTIPGARVTWSSLDTLIARVDPYGRVTARDTGSARIVAATGALRDTASIAVAPDTTAPAPPRAVPPAQSGLAARREGGAPTGPAASSALPARPAAARAAPRDRRRRGPGRV